MSGLTAAELAHRAGTAPEWIERLAELGILERGEGERPFAERDLGEVLVSAAVAGAVDEDAGIALEPVGDIGLRGVSEPVPLFRAVIRDSSPGEGRGTLSA